MTPPPDPELAGEPERAPERIGRRDPTRVVLEWRDGAASSLAAPLLRRACPCARCVHELTGEPLLDPRSVPDDLTQTSVELVGRYGLAIRFSDGHHTGIYTWALLRALG